MRSSIRLLAVLVVFVCGYHHVTKYGMPFGLGQGSRVETLSDGGRRIDLRPLIEGPGRTVIEFTADW